MIIDRESICYEIEQLYVHSSLTMFDCIFATCEKYNVDYEYISTIINRSIREKLKVDAINLKLMKSNTNILEGV